MRCRSYENSLKQGLGNDLENSSLKYSFSAQEIIRYEKQFDCASKGKGMTEKRFRKGMDLLGLKSISVLADRIFKCMDKTNKSKVDFEEFLDYMNIAMHGTLEEKYMQSYRLISLQEDHISYQEFSNWLKTLWKVENELTGIQIESGEENIKDLFLVIDLKKDGIIDFEEYCKGVNSHSYLLQWFNFTSLRFCPRTTDLVESENEYIEEVKNTENKLQNCLELLTESEGESKVVEEGGIQDKRENIEIQEFPIENLECAQEFHQEIALESTSHIEPRHLIHVDSQISSKKIHSESPVTSSQSPSKLLEKFQGLFQKVNSLQTGEEIFRSSTLFNVPKNNMENIKIKISLGDQESSMIVYMILGIQQAVNAYPEVDCDILQPEYYGEMVKSQLISQNNPKTCRFRDYAPKIFGKLRHFFAIENMEYIKGLGVEKIMDCLLKGEFSSLVGLISSGRSRSFFYFSDDGSYVIKTMSLEEIMFLKKILPDYFNYIHAEPESFIPKFFGLHNIRYYSGVEKLKKSFIVMENLFSGGYEIHLRFDLKGSTAGRSTDPGEDISVARKDLDFNRSGIKIRLVEGDKFKVLEQLRKDCDFFQRLEIIDYSLLLGIHHLKNPVSDISQLKNAYISADGQYLYFFGIIDILTRYNALKKFENMIKTSFLGEDISCVPPKKYADRFYNYISSVIE